MQSHTAYQLAQHVHSLAQLQSVTSRSPFVLSCATGRDSPLSWLVAQHPVTGREIKVIGRSKSNSACNLCLLMCLFAFVCVRCRNDLLVRAIYRNTLPDVPMDPKLLSMRSLGGDGLMKYATYRQTVLEQTLRVDLPPGIEAVVAAHVHEHLVVPMCFEKLKNWPEIDAIDLILLKDDEFRDPAHGQSEKQKRSEQHRKIVPWMKTPLYTHMFTSSESTASSRAGEETMSVKERRRKAADDLAKFCSNKNERLRRIEKMFEDAKLPILTHHTRPDLTPISVMPLLPDFENWRHSFAEVVFENPLQVEGIDAEEKMNNALLRGLANAAGVDIVGYFLPTDKTLAKLRALNVEQKPDTGNNETILANSSLPGSEEYEYVLHRENDFSLQAADGQNRLFFSLRDNCVYYNEMERTVHLRRRVSEKVMTRLVVKLRPENQADFEKCDYRKRLLEPIIPVREDDPQLSPADTEYDSSRFDHMVDQLESIQRAEQAGRATTTDQSSVGADQKLSNKRKRHSSGDEYSQKQKSSRSRKEFDSPGAE